ncbi:T-cell immunomodulatory protein [Dissostichus eleginoides]|uniref:T-cell immunomodulatory protein n=1 Tax=Dissostichus eleginoides TaxID=100907 RepID=A0AAD9F7E0_DISEL|nr:T-cell immunomodulatory protein [Dissostichus eleginoides]
MYQGKGETETEAGQLSQSAHFSLQLPYTVLGLGRSANFLDHLFVGIPRKPGETAARMKEWTAIIPNSQLIVIPFPQNQPSRKRTTERRDKKPTVSISMPCEGRELHYGRTSSPVLCLTVLPP